jgi:hypothetical protein
MEDAAIFLIERARSIVDRCRAGVSCCFKPMSTARVSSYGSPATKKGLSNARYQPSDIDIEKLQ